MITLAISTGQPQIDEIIRGIIGLFETVFPGRIRGCYLVGSYADGSAVALSDIDLRVVFKEDFVDSAEEEKVRRVRNHCRLISPVSIDLPPLSETRLISDEAWLHETISIKSASRFLYGEDLRHRLPLPELDAYVRNVTSAPVLFLPTFRGREMPLVFPLEYPDPSGEFYGYDSAGSGGPRGTKMLVHAAGFAASSLLALLAKQIVTRKSDWLPLYQAHVNDEWTPLLEALYRRCKQEWAYRVPEAETDRHALRQLCQRTLSFENFYLARYGDYLLTHLQSERRDHRLFAARRLKDVVYPGLRAALAAVEIDDEELRQAIDTAQEVGRRAAPGVMG